MATEMRIDQAIARQNQLLPGVSRTFALTIPQLAEPLNIAVTNAYLLCRIADTIEDDPGLSIEQKQTFHQQFIEIVDDKITPEQFIQDLVPLLSEKTSKAERNLIAETDLVIQVTHSLNDKQRAALTRCVRIMCSGMPTFQRVNTAGGLNKMTDMDRYCYYVAGVVGEMLTELFCDYSEAMNENYKELMDLSISFGQGLQMTNILKDVWDDRQVNACWLPQEIFEQYDLKLDQLSPNLDTDSLANDGFAEGMSELVGIARAHLENALKYTRYIPKSETGIRRFCLWAIGMAVLTLRNIHNNPEFLSGQDVKISRRKVKATVALTSMFCRSNRALGMLFNIAEQGLPKEHEVNLHHHKTNLGRCEDLVIE